MASKSKRRRKVLGASCILAALIIAGSSFAWFTSKDEVTNRLSASANYGVSIAEDFTPPENWLPGQKVDKNVGVVNTGNVDAFVRTWLEGEMNVLAEKRDTQKWDSATNVFKDSDATSTTALKLTDTYTASTGVIATGGTSTITKETDSDLIANDLTYYYMLGNSTDKDAKISLKELKTDTYLNPNSPITTVSSPEGYSDVMAVQAGGELVYVNSTGSAFSFIFTPNQTQTITSAGVSGGTGGKTYDINGGTTYTVNITNAALIGTNNGDDIEVATGNVVNVKDLDTFYKYLGDNIDTNTFQPKTTGLYIFKRNTNSTANAYPDYEYSGYYYVTSGEENVNPASNVPGKYFALQYENDGTLRSDYVLEKETYTVVRDDTGKETFVPYQQKATLTGTYAGNYYKVGSTWYDSTGSEIATADATTYGLDSATTTDNSVTLFTAQKQVVENSALTWTYADGSKTNGTEVENNGIVYKWNGSKWLNGTTEVTDSTLIARLDAAADNPATLTASWVGVDGDAATTADNISVTVNLTNIGTAAEKWTAVAKTGATATDQRTFYYNNDVEEGATTAKLVDSVELSKDTTKNAYIAFDFDLNVFMESMQVTIDDNGKEAYESVSAWGATSDGGAGYVNTGATGANVASTQTGSEIENIQWTYAAP